MITFIIRSKIRKHNHFVYFFIKSIVIFHEKNNFAVYETNTFMHKNNILAIIKNKKYEIIILLNFLIFPVFYILNKTFFT